MLSLAFLALSLNALTIDIKRGIEKGHPFAILHIEDKNPFECSEEKGEYDMPPVYLCRFDKMPESELQDIGNDFFNISFKKRKGEFLCRIALKKRGSLFPLPPPLHENGILPSLQKRSYRHWMVLGYTDEPPYLGMRERFEESIIFPLDLKEYAIPTVGAVDINGNPVFMKNNRDVERFISVKEAFRAGKYKRAYDLATEALEAHPDSIFASDFLRYRIKSLAQQDMKEHAEEIIKLGKRFIKRYTSDEYLPEVLLILARVYSATGFESDANYFFDRLIEEHKGDRFADLGLIYLGDQLYINGKTKEAIKRYLEAYYGTKELDIASLAAYKLAIRYLDMGKTEKGVEYIRKIWEKNPGFILKDKEDAHEIAKQLAARKVFDLAIEIDKALLNRLKKLDDLYERIIFEIAEWYDEKGDIKEAIEWYERYLDEFAYGEFSDEAKKSLDALFVTGNEGNATQALEKFESLMRDYRGGPIADKALAAKARVLLALKRYEEVLKLAPLIEKIDDEKVKEEAQRSLKSAAEALFERSVEAKECKSAVETVERYGVEVKRGQEEFIFGCYEKYARYDDALRIAKRHLHDKKSRERESWLCRTLHVLVLSERFSDAVKASEDLLSLAGRGAASVCPTYEWDRVKALFAEGRYAEAVSLVKKMSKRYGDDIRMVEVYKAGYDAAKRESDTLQQRWMLQKIIELQNLKRSHPYSPWAEFELMRLYKKEGRISEALKLAESMRDLDLEGEKRARWLYELGTLYESSGETAEAGKSFKECSKVKNGGAWKRLCEEALPLQQ
ncbi:paralysed flagella protein PflA [Hydrogenimonas sp.]|nr:paralysed flagella protein PflA [Hydrogenimonas sp.]